MLNEIFLAHDDNRRMTLIDELYKINEGRKNSLTGESGNAINTFIFAFNPSNYTSVVSLNDRKRVIDYFGFGDSPDFDKDTQGAKIVLSNKVIINGFRNIGINATPRTISCFLYESAIRDYWRGEREDESSPWDNLKQEVEDKAQEVSNIELFYMESQLEDFLIENWDKTELGKKYDLIE